MGREVKTESAALARTNKPLKAEQVTLAQDGLENVISGLGTARDKRSYTQYTFTLQKTRDQLDNMFRQSWLAKRIVNAPAEDMCRAWLTVKFDDTDKEHLDAVEQAASLFNVASKTQEGLSWGRLYGGAIMVIGIRGQNPASPLNIESLKQGSLQYLHVLDRWRVSASAQLTTDLESPNFGLPEYYTIAESTVNFHHSRVIRFNGQKVPYFLWTQNGRWDDPELQHVYESLLNCDTSTQSVASMLFEATIDVIKVANLAEILAGKNGEANLTKRFQLGALMKSFNKMLLLGGEETYENHQKQFTNLDKIMEKFMIDVAGAAEIPVTRLFGQAPAGLNATGDADVRNYYDRIASKQKTDLKPQMEYLYKILCLHSIGRIPDDFCIEFNPLWQLSASEIATQQKTRAERDKLYYDMGVLNEGTIARQLKMDGTYSELTDEDVELAEELSREPEELPVEEVAVPGQAAAPQQTGTEQIAPGEEPTED
jgi:phage-related protein (TIGR01555 family)